MMHTELKTGWGVMGKRRWLRIEDRGHGIVVEKEILGQTFSFSLGIAQATIVFPRVVSNEFPKELSQYAGVKCLLTLSDLGNAGFKVSANMEQEFGSLHCGEGFYYQGFLSPEGLVSAELRRFAYIIEAESDLDCAPNDDSMWRLWDPYWALCKDWLEILTEQDITSGSTWSSKRRDFNVWTENGDGTEALNHAYNDIQSHSVNSLIPSQPISRRILEKSLIQAESSAQIPLDHRLFRDARRSINLGEFRKAVIDCGSAIEIVLFNQLRQKYLAEGKSIKYVNGIEKNWTLGKIIKAWQRDGLQDFSNLDSKVSDLRNEIIHRGISCGVDKAIFVYDLTREIVKTLGTRVDP